MIQAIRAALAVPRQFSPVKIFRIRTIRRFSKGEDGATMVEFALVAAPFFALMYAIMETALVFFASQTLETAVSDSARLIMTGQAQGSNYTAAQFKTAVCGKIYGLFDCANGIYVDVKTYTDFSSVDNSTPVDSNGNLKVSSFGYSPGLAGQIVVVKLMYQWPVYASLLGFNLSNMAGNKRLLMATAAFRNEPF